MEIKVKQNEQRVPFSHIARGDVFVYEGEVYMRLMYDYIEYDENGYKGDTFNVIHLGDAELYEFRDHYVVNKPTKIVPMEISY